jgi:hypothetical protein
MDFMINSPMGVLETKVTLTRNSPVKFCGIEQWVARSISRTTAWLMNQGLLIVLKIFERLRYET